MTLDPPESPRNTRKTNLLRTLRGAISQSTSPNLIPHLLPRPTLSPMGYVKRDNSHMSKRPDSGSGVGRGTVQALPYRKPSQHFPGFDTYRGRFWGRGPLPTTQAIFGDGSSFCVGSTLVDSWKTPQFAIKNQNQGLRKIAEIRHFGLQQRTTQARVPRLQRGCHRFEPGRAHQHLPTHIASPMYEYFANTSEASPDSSNMPCTAVSMYFESQPI